MPLGRLDGIGFQQGAGEFRAFGYGFKVTVAATTSGTDTIKDAKIKQEIFLLLVAVNRGSGEECLGYLADEGEPRGKRKDFNDLDSAINAHRQWKNGNPATMKMATDITNKQFFANDRAPYYEHNNSTLVYVDAPGHTQKQVQASEPGGFHYLVLYAALRITATGTDGHTVTAAFKYAISAAQSAHGANSWSIDNVICPDPKLPKVWK